MYFQITCEECYLMSLTNRICAFSLKSDNTEMRFMYKLLRENTVHGKGYEDNYYWKQCKRNIL